MTGETRQTLLQTRLFSVVRHQRVTSGGEVVIRDSVQHPGAVAILPIFDDGAVCLIRNYRVAVGQTLWEIPAGTLEANEDPAECARRELTEETGYRCGLLEKIHEFFMSPGILNERMHLFLATQLTPGPTALEPHEQIETHRVGWNDAWEMVRRGEIQDAKTLVGLALYQSRKSHGV